MTKEELAKKVFDVAHLTGKFNLRSGIVSNEYFDKYQFEARPDLLDEITTQQLALLPNDYDVLGALEVGGIPIGTLLSQKTHKPICFVRKKAKDYGTAKFAEGLDIKGKHLLIVEDVVTSGGQIILSAEDLRKEGATITQAICVIDREQGGREKLKEAGIELISLFTMSELKK